MAGHIVLVEDSALAADPLRLLFESIGARVTVAASVAEAIAACEADPPDLLLLDLTLPDGSGLGVLEALRNRGRAPAVSVALTGHDGAEVRARCLAAGCADVLVKPVPARELMRRVRAWLAPQGAGPG
ncbi:MAG TPA: response regulator [Gemmatimonadaceae bacterium]|nr:response regulator [Gemmatimonadaceae bacterium]